MSLHSLPIHELLQSYNALEEEFITRKMMKKHADVVGGYTEHLVCHALGLKHLAARPRKTSDGSMMGGTFKDWSVR